MPPNWQEFSQENLRHCNQERETSMRLRGVIGQTLSQTSQDMREQADRVEESLSRRVSETEEATRGLEDQLKQVCECNENTKTILVVSAREFADILYTYIIHLILLYHYLEISHLKFTLIFLLI